MAQKIDFAKPFLDLTKLVPSGLQNPVSTGLLGNLFNRFMTRDESVPFYGYVGRKPSNPEDTSPPAASLSVERDVNAIIPVLSFTLGSEQKAFTVQDLMNKARVLGMDTDDQAWLYSQANNFRPPISFDKFTNFFNYYWVARAVDSVVDMPWNFERLPEYYTIAPPQLGDLTKLNVVSATAAPENLVLTGSGFIDQTFILTFTSATGFTVATTAPLLGPRGTYTPVATTFALLPTPPLAPPGTTPADLVDTFTFTVTGPAGLFTLVTFSIVREPTFNSANAHIGYTGFLATDTFTISTTYLSSNYNVSFTGTAGIKGKVTAVVALNDYQPVGGHTISTGDRVLIKDQNNSLENGIYIVSRQGWSRAPDFNTATWAAGARTFVTLGTNAGRLFVSAGSAPNFSWADTGITESNTNDWQEGNYWVRGEDLDAMGLDRTSVMQAVRPIIEFDSGLQLNSAVDAAGIPSGNGFGFKQEKYEFNQLPLFDLFRYDGTHSGLVSSIFYYVEDLTADLDLAIQRRLKRSTNDSADFVFNHGCADAAGNLLFFKTDNVLKTVWHAGYLSETVIDVSQAGTGDGVLAATTVDNTAQQQVWTLSAVSASSFQVVGTKLASLPAPFDYATVGVPYNNGEVSFTITAGATAFVAGDSFTLRVGNLERPRYVFRAADTSIQDFFGGAAADVQGVGAYAVSRTFYNNPYNDSRAEILEGSLYTHFRSVLANQVGGLDINYSFGGNIKLWSEQHTLLAGLLMQKDLTPITLIDMAKRQYDTAINSVRDIYLTRIVEYFSTNTVVDFDGSPEQTEKVNALLDAVLVIRANDNDVRTVLYDSTASVTGFPITLPAMGLADLVAPEIRFDRVLGTNVMVHHDGHYSSLAADDADFRNLLLGTYTNKVIVRSDGTSTPAIGSFTAVQPAQPYKGLLWLRPNAGAQHDLLAFDVLYDTVSTPTVAAIGEFWYNRTSNTLYESDGVNWIVQPSPSVAWRVVNLADTLNALMFAVEMRMFNGINPDQRQFDFSSVIGDPVFLAEMQRELSNFGAQNGLDPLGTNYDPSDSFTWNYSQGNTLAFPPLSGATVPARWYNILLQHQATVFGVIPTERPNFEPWRLFGFPTYAAWWSTLSPLVQASYTSVNTDELADGTYTFAGKVRVVSADPIITPLTGLPVIDGVQLASGDRVLLQNEGAPANNGIWTVSAGSWSRSGSLSFKMYVEVLDGQRFGGTRWWLSAPVVIINTDPVLFLQVRLWTQAMWADLAAARPGLRTSVSPWTDELLPPYVNGSLPNAVWALTNFIPLGVALPYQFGEGSPVEEVWSRNIEYRYSLVKTLCRYDPLALLGFAWGFNWVEVDNILYDGFDVNLPGHRRFRIHGEAVSSPHTAADFVHIAAAGNGDITLTYDAYAAGQGQSFSIRDTATGVLLGTILEGVTQPLVLGGVVLSSVRIEDYGQPYHTGDRFRVTSAGIMTTVVFTPATSHQILGLGQTFTNALREIAIDTQSSFAVSAYREWDVNMGHRAGGLVSTEDLKIYNESETLNASSYSLLIKKNEITRDIWMHALRVTVFQTGVKAVTTPSQTGPEYRGTEFSAPAGDGGDWVFRIEGYNPRYTAISYYSLDTPDSGMDFPAAATVGARFFRHDLGQLFTFSGSGWDITGTSDIVTFNALDQTATDTTWFQPRVRTGVVNSFLPLTITGVQNLVSFLFGYSQYCEDIGWRFDGESEFSIDQVTGRHRNWQLEIEKTVDSIYRGLEIGQGHVCNPFIDRVWVAQETGLLAEFADTSLFDITGNSGVFDILGVRYNTSDLRPVRGNTRSSVSATGPMFSVHAQIDEYEHLFIFNDYVNQSNQSGLLYDAFSGSRSVTYKFNGKKQGSGTLRPEYGGHYVLGNSVLPNMQASTDNLDRMYDANYAFENTLTTQHALALMGFSTKDYFGNLDITDKTQFNFWRGLIHSKGTNMSIDAYLNSNRFQEAKIDEYWAYKIAEYGDSRQLSYPEMKIEVSDSLQQFTRLQFDAAPGSELGNFTQISRFDETRWFSIDDLDQDAFFKAEPVGTFSRTALSANEVLTLPFIADKIVLTNAVRLNATTIRATAAGLVTAIGWGPATPRYNPIKLFNYVDAALVEEIPMWHPATGQHTPVAMEAINIIGPADQARYNYSTLVQGNGTFDPLRPWGDREIGRTWFDTRNLAYVPYYDTTIFTNRPERLSRWGAVADFGTIDVYEWVKSTVPPAEYAALAAVEALDANIDPADKASGEVALPETYVRNRRWFIRPVAWSEASLQGGHPSLGSGSYDTPLFIDGNVFALGDGSLSERAIGIGTRLGAFNYDPAVQKPYSEANVIGFTKKIRFDDFAYDLAPRVSSTGVPCRIEVEAGEYGPLFGQLIFAPAEPGPSPWSVTVTVSDTGTPVAYTFNVVMRVTNVATGDQELVQLSTLFGITNTLPALMVSTDQVFTFTVFGLQLTVTVDVGGTYLGTDLLTAIVDTLGYNVSVLDAVIVAPIVNIPSDIALEYITNDVDDIGWTANNGIGWAAWEVPTQAELDSDGRQPRGAWRPYVGDFVEIPVIDDLAPLVTAVAPMLNDGTAINRYSTEWSEWVLLEDTVYPPATNSPTATVTGPIAYTHFENIDSTQTTVYVNGIAQLKSAYTIFGDTITITSVTVGHQVRVIVRKYAPSLEQFAFNPDVEDDLTFQQHYKVDYEYVSAPTRDAEGSLSTTFYYYWVKNRSVIAQGKKLSLQSIVQNLRTGPPSYLTFQTPDAGMLGDGSASDPFGYDAITVSGLSYLVTKNNTFKLRFTRNFTLRDDPQGIELKNTHTEWGLIRPQQRTRIPEFLWNRLVDSMAGLDAAGSVIPSLRRVLYDERNGTFTRFGFGPEQTLAPSGLLRLSVEHTILNTSLTDTSGSTTVPDFITFLDQSQSDMWFADVAATRATMAQIWNAAKVTQINEIFFAALEDILASNLEMTDIFKTSRLSAYSIRTVTNTTTVPTYE